MTDSYCPSAIHKLQTEVDEAPVISTVLSMMNFHPSAAL
jgi:inhibitor of KinA sporulation pathway (predicted exonuclease)